MIDFIDTAMRLSRMMTLAGREYEAEDELAALAAGYFDQWERDSLGNYIFRRRPAVEGAAKLMIDAHFDAVGLMVYEITKEGNLKVVSVGGVDPKVLPAAEVTIHAERELYGVIAAKPPHLTKPDERTKVTPIDELLIDTGYSKEELEGLGVRIGTPVTFGYLPERLKNNRAAGCAFDDKACVAAGLLAFDMMGEDRGAFDTYFVVSAQEETGMSGAEKAAFRIKPDLALVLDVGFASSPDSPEKNSVAPLGSGAVVSVSAATSASLTSRVMKICDRCGVKYTVSVEASGTGSNADEVPFVECGIDTVLLGIPLRSMHTESEVIDGADGEELAKLLVAVMKDTETEAAYHE
ncbi:MAG: M20/M25/M40 family metallo-hydrolase [Firmicutes bacterium]|nr:M20/M25/M40 family metallo-hydrolase [Bacillota bacterium]